MFGLQNVPMYDPEAVKPMREDSTGSVLRQPNQLDHAPILVLLHAARPYSFALSREIRFHSPYVKYVI